MLGNEVVYNSNLTLRYTIDEYFNSKHGYESINEFDLNLIELYGAIWNPYDEKIAFKTEEELIKFQLQFF